ncbi:MAG TPA: ABC transporter permease subunit [Solirubrobacteraceae bacterium]|jgi:ABC-type spermidine/putrescine transport system permease subunit II
MRRDRLAGAAGALALALVALSMLAPAALVVALSFSNERVFDFPPHAWGFRQYRVLFEDPRWGSALWLSVRVAVPVALLAAALVVPMLLAVHRSRLPGRHALALGGLTGLVLPASAYAVAIYAVFAQVGLLGTYLGLVLADLTLAIPVMLLVTSPALSRIPEDLELAAMVAGANRARAWVGITVRLLAPAIFAGLVLAFMASFDEAVFVNFIAGPEQETLPKAIFDSIRYGLDPVVTAIATLLILGTSAATILAVRLAAARQ